MLSLGAYLTGTAILAAITLPLVYVATRLRSHLLPTWTGAPARLAETTLFLTLLLLTSQLLGAIGLFQPAALIPASLSIALAVFAVTGRLHPRVAARGHNPSSLAHPTNTRSRLQLPIAITATAIAFAHWAIPTLQALDRGMYGFDGHWYHLPFAARFAETGSILEFHHTTPVLLSWFYPANSELLHALGMVAFERDLLSPLLNLGWLAFALLAAWCLGRPWGVGGLAVLGVFVVVEGGIFADQAGEARNDVMAAACILAACALLVQRPIPIATSGLAAGLALGTRFTSLAPVAMLTAGAIWLARRGKRLRAGAVWGLAIVATGGLWYLRNLVATGNPLPQLSELGPLSLPGPDQALGGRPSFSVAHYATDFEVWVNWFAPALREALGLLWPLVLGLAAAGAVLALVRGPLPAVRVLGAVAIATGIAYLVTPVTASGPEGQPVGFGPNLRYLAPGLALALALLPVALTTLGPRSRVIGAVALAAAAFAVAAEPDRWQDRPLAAVAIGAGVAISLAGVILIARRRSESAGERSAWPLRPAPLAGLLVAVAAATIGIGYFEQREYLRERYAQPADVLGNPGLAAAFRWANEVSNARIGTTLTRQYPLYGTDLSNHVQFVGVEGPTASFTHAATCESWRRAVNTGDFDYLVVGLDRADPAGPTVPPERAWTRTSSNADEIVHEGPTTIFHLSGPLDPDKCA